MVAHTHMRAHDQNERGRLTVSKLFIILYINVCGSHSRDEEEKIETTYSQDTFPVSIISTDVQTNNSEKT